MQVLYGDHIPIRIDFEECHMKVNYYTDDPYWAVDITRGESSLYSGHGEGSTFEEAFNRAVQGLKEHSSDSH